MTRNACARLILIMHKKSQIWMILIGHLLTIVYCFCYCLYSPKALSKASGIAEMTEPSQTKTAEKTLWKPLKVLRKLRQST